MRGGLQVLPFKLILFVPVDGWSLVAGSLVQSYGG
jgi:flagellar biosynthetic protein FliP